MRIGLDLWPTVDRGGIGRYASELARALVALGQDGSAHEVVLFPGKEQPVWVDEVLNRSPSSVRLGCPLWRGRRKGFPTRILRANLLGATRFNAQRLDVFHSADFFDTPLVGLGRTKTVTTVHDISPILHPETVTPRHAWFFRALIRPLVRRADWLITVSRSTAEEIVEWDPTLGRRLSVIHEGVSSDFYPVEPRIVAAMRAQYHLPEEYILCLGTVQPRKNLSRLLEAFALMVRHDAFLPPLVIAGSLGWLYEPILRRVAELRLDSRVRFLGFVPDDDLPALLSGASVFVFPSIHEGFGLPVLEAMACGVPVVTSNRSSLPEVAGDAAVLVDPFRAEAIAEGIRGVLGSKVTAVELRRLGLQRASVFTWADTARKTLGVYRNCLLGTGRMSRGTR